MRAFARIAIGALAALLVAGCNVAQPPPPAPPSGQGSTVMALDTPAPVFIPTAVPPIRPTLPSQAPQVISLTMWTTEVFSPLQNDLGSRILRQQVDEFHAQEPNIDARFVLKKAYGRGGMSHALQAAAAVAPVGLPDVAIVDLAELPGIARAGLTRPLDGLISPHILADLFPFAAEAGRIDAQSAGLPFEVEVWHLAYSTSRLPGPPLTWTDVLSAGVGYVFPAGSDPASESANEVIWLHYLAALGGPLRQVGESPTLQQTPLREMLTFYDEGVQRGVIPQMVLEFRTEADAWPAYLSEKAGLVSVSSLRYLSSRGLLAGTAYSAATTPDGRPFSVATGWAYVIVTKDPARQAAAARLIEWLMEPGRNATWTRAANRLPPTRRAMAAWGPTDPYGPFARALLENAAPLPAGPDVVPLGRALTRAVRDVLMGNATPSDAAASAVAGG